MKPKQSSLAKYLKPIENKTFSSSNTNLIQNMLFELLSLVLFATASPVPGKGDRLHFLLDSLDSTSNQANIANLVSQAANKLPKGQGSETWSQRSITSALKTIQNSE